MYTDRELLEALDYFTRPQHSHSFEVLNGEGGVMLSAPHAVLQTRNGLLKQAERYTGMLCSLLNRYGGCPCIFKTRHMRDDANHDQISDYRDALCQYIQRHDIRYLLDLHQLSPERPMDVCLGTGRGNNLHGDQEIVPVLIKAFENHGFSDVTIDEPFSASSPHTVCATVAEACRIPAVQIELNTRLLCEDSRDERFKQVMAALEETIQKLNNMRK